MITLQCCRAMLQPALEAETEEGLERWAIQDALAAQDLQDRLHNLTHRILAELELADASLLGKPGAGTAVACHRRIVELLNEKAPLERGPN